MFINPDKIGITFLKIFILEFIVGGVVLYLLLNL